MRRYEDLAEAMALYLPEADLDLVQRAYVYSAKVHAGQVRKSGEPYLIHPLEVAYLLTQLRLDEASVATGLLHDAVEDTLATLDDLRNLFGDEVATLVDGVTKLSQIRFDTDEHKQAENFRKMLVAMAKDIRVILVKLADRLHNMRTLQHLRPDKQRRIAQETLDIYAPLANRLGIHWVKSELEDLSFQYVQPEDFKKMEQQVAELKSAREGYVRHVVSMLKEELRTRGVESEVHGRQKHLYGIYTKMRTRNLEFDQVYDIIAFRVLVDNVGQCYEVLGHVHSLWPPIPGRFKDFIAMPKPNQYQSLHTSVIGPTGDRIEIQIRTKEMHRIAEEGIAAHWEYKEKETSKRLADKGKKQFAWLRQLLEWQQDLQDPGEFLDVVKYDLFTDEVFVFTPRGEVISLQRGATPVDFAFSIHSQVGTHCAGAKVNGRMVPLRYELKNGDIVEILTNPQQRPSKDWLTFVRTGRAKAKIRAIVRTEERARSQELGHDLLERELRRHDISLPKLLRDGKLQELTENGRYGSLEGLYISIGYGKTTVAQILEKLGLAQPAENEDTKPAGEIEPPKVPQRRASGGVLVHGMDDVLVRFAKCCTPLPGEKITGFVTRGRGITVHVNGCTRALDVDPARRVDVTWDENPSFLRPISLRVVTSDKPGILATVSQVFTDNSVNINQANCKVTGEDRAINTFEVLIKSADQLRRVVGNIKQLKGVLTVERL